MNPGPPPCEGGVPSQASEGDGAENKCKLTTRVAAPPRPPVDNSLLSGFREWLEGQVSGDTAEYYSNVVRRRMWPPGKRKHVKAWRKYIQFLFSVGRIDWGRMQQYLAFLRLGGNRRETQRAVPLDTIVRYGEVMEGNGLGDLYLLLLGGARLKHILRMAGEWNPLEQVKHPTSEFEPRLWCSNDWCRYYLGLREGSKRADYIYFPLTGERVRIPQLEYRQLKDKLRKLGVQAKVFRKFANQVLEELAHRHNIRLDAVNLIMSRELSVTGTSYVNVRDWADRLFALYVEWLRENKLL